MGDGCVTPVRRVGLSSSDRHDYRWWMDVLAIAKLPPVMGLVALGAQRLLSRGSTTSRSSSLVGAVVAAAGVAVAAAAIREIRSAGTTLDPSSPAEATSLVRQGAFRYSRNPIYLGDALVLLGYAIHRRNLLALAPVVAFVEALDLGQIPAEEDALLAHFGSTYGDYVASVRRWF